MQRAEAAFVGRSTRWRLALPALLAGALAAACGNTSRNGEQPFLPQGAQGGSGGSIGVGGGAGAGAAGMPVVTQPVPGDMHRLSRFEYESSVHDVLATDAPVLQLPASVLNGFDNNGAVQLMPPQQFDEFYKGARAVAHAVFATPELKARVIVCADGTSACADSLLDRAGLQLFRRPLSAEERPIYLALYAKLRAQGLEPDAALEQVLVSLLASSQFLYRMELPSQAEPEPLDPYELASRLSYLIWSSAPDETLLEAARVDALSDDAQLEAQLTRMWADERSHRFVLSFAGQWLGAQRVFEHDVDARVFPAWTAQVPGAVANEVYTTFDDLLRNDRDFLDLYRGAPHDADAVLAPIYGGPAADPGASSVKLQGERASYLGSIAFLTSSSWYQRTSPTLRGHDILVNVLCQQLPPPPASVPKLEEPQVMGIRESIEHISQDAACRPCHQMMDPLGLALEQYDAIGQFRKSYSTGEPIDSRIALPPSPVFPQDLIMDGLPGVMERVLQDPASKRCAAEKLYDFAIGGFFKDVDAQNIDAIAAGWEQGPLTVKQLARELVLSKTFRFKLARKVDR